MYFLWFILGSSICFTKVNYANFMLVYVLIYLYKDKKNNRHKQMIVY